MQFSLIKWEQEGLLIHTWMLLHQGTGVSAIHRGYQPQNSNLNKT